MLPAIYNPTIKQGVPFRRKFIVTDDAGAPLDITGATGKGSILNANGNKLADLAFDFTAAATGTVEMLLLDTFLLPGTGGIPMYPYEVFILPVAGDPICPFEGLITVEATGTDLT